MYSGTGVKIDRSVGTERKTGKQKTITIFTFDNEAKTYFEKERAYSIYDGGKTGFLSIEEEWK